MTASNDATFSWDSVARYLREITLGEYEILTELGRGGMAAVFLAHEHALNRKVALKVMSPAIMMTEGMVDRFYAEAVTQANLTHAHIVGVHSVRRDQELHYFAMQYVPGRSLQQVLRAEQAARRDLPLPVIQSLLYQVGSALAYAHRRGVIHRDIKPANVLLNADGDAVVTDFGIAKVASNPSQTMTGTVVGTAPYMSPEQCYAAELTGASDQYSLGILAYELLTGSPPFVGNSFAVMQAHTLEAPPPIRPRRADCPPDFEAAVLKMLSKSSEDRYADVIAALGGLDARSASPRTDDPVRATLVRLADVAGVEASLGDVLRVPLSPMPRTRRAGSSTPGAHPRLGTPPAGYIPLKAESSRVIMLRLGDPPSRVESGELLRLEAEAMDIHGAPLAGLPLRWSSSNPKIARVTSDTGEIEALAPGSADIVVSCENAVATARLVVREAAVAGIVGVGMPEFVEVGDRVTLRAEAFDARGGRLDRPVRWSIATSPAAIVSGDGVLTARAPGTALVTATVESTRTEFQISIRAPGAATIEQSGMPAILAIGETVGVTATTRDKRGNVLTGRLVKWTSDNPSVAVVDSSGAVTGVAQGEAAIESRCDDARAVTRVSVGVVPITTLEVSGIPERLKEGARKRLEVTARDTDGRLRKIPAVWTSSAPAVATVDPSNELNALSPGHATLRVRCGSAERLFSIEVRPNVAISQRAREAMSRVPRPDANRLVKGAIALGSIAAVGALIAFIAIQSRDRPAGGETAGGASDTTLHLQIAQIATIMRVGEGGTPELQASRGGIRVETGDAQWSSSNPAVVAVEPRTGLVTAMGEGAATLLAVVGNDTTSLPIRVEGSSVAGASLLLTISGVPTPMRIGEAVTPELQASRGGTRVATGDARWSSSNPRIFTVDTRTGRMTAVREGTAILAAKIGSDSAAVPIRVAGGSAEGADLLLRISGIATSMRIGDGMTPELQASRDGRRIAVPGRGTWRSSNPSVLAVESRTGRVAAVGEGTATLFVRVGRDSTFVSIHVERIAVGGVSIASNAALTSLRVGDSAQAHARVNDSNGSELPSRAVVWSVEPADVATVDNAGWVRARSAGTARLIASADNVRDTLPLTIRALQVNTAPRNEVRDSATPRSSSGSGTSGATNPPPASVPLAAEHVSTAAAQIRQLITSPDTAGVIALYAGGTGDGRLRQLTDAMQSATEVVFRESNAGTFVPDPRNDGDRTTARIRMTLEFRYRATSRRPLLDLELDFRRDGAGWRLAAFRIMNNPSYR